jgi:hypothetical protein
VCFTSCGGTSANGLVKWGRVCGAGYFAGEKTVMAFVVPVIFFTFV